MTRGILTEDPGDLQIGDEIITYAGAQMRCFVVEEVPRVSKKKAWYDGTKRYVAVKCRSAMTEKTSTHVNSWLKRTYTTTHKTYEFRVPNENDPIVKVDLNFKQIYIINKFNNG
jgi:hypothetical protein